jgi:hypothetical protein
MLTGSELYSGHPNAISDRQSFMSVQAEPVSRATEHETDANDKAAAVVPAPAKTLRFNANRAGSGVEIGNKIAQAKLAVGPAGDPYEREADAVAGRVVRALRSKSASVSENEATTPRVQRGELGQARARDRSDAGDGVVPGGGLSRIQRAGPAPGPLVDERAPTRGPQQQKNDMANRVAPGPAARSVPSAPGGTRRGTDKRFDSFSGPAPEAEAERESMASRAHGALETALDPAATTIGNDNVSGLNDGLQGKGAQHGGGGNLESRIEAAEEGSAEEQELQTLQSQTTAMGVAADSYTGIMGFATFCKAYNDPGGLMNNKLDAAIGTAQVVESGAKLTATSSGSKGAAKFGSAFEGVQSALMGIKALLDGAQSWRQGIEEEVADDLAGEGPEAEDTGLGWAEAQKALEMTRSWVAAAKSFQEIIGNAPGGLLAIIPALDIALASVNIFVGYRDIAEWKLNVKNMETELAAIADRRLQERPESDRKTELEWLANKSDRHRQIDALRTNSEVAFEQTERRVAKDDPKWYQKWKKTEDKAALRERAVSLKIDVALQEALRSKVDDPDVNEFQLVMEIKDANLKRINRKMVVLVGEVLKVGGGISKLVPGAGTVVGAGLSGAGSAVQMSLPVARAAKQAGRDRNARKVAKGKQGSSDTYFDVTKSTAAKHDYRVKQATTLWNMIGKLAGQNTSDLKFQKDVTRTRGLIEATGVHYNSLLRERDPQTAFELLLKGIKARE